MSSRFRSSGSWSRTLPPHCRDPPALQQHPSGAEQPASLRGLQHPGDEYVPGPDGEVGTGDDGGLITYYEYSPDLSGAQFEENMLVNDRGARQRFNSIELSAVKRLAYRWQFAAYRKRARRKTVPYIRPWRCQKSGPRRPSWGPSTPTTKSTAPITRRTGREAVGSLYLPVRRHVRGELRPPERRCVRTAGAPGRAGEHPGHRSERRPVHD